MKVRFYFALWASKCIKFFLRLFKKSASHFPGVVALKICPDFLKNVKKANLVIAVTVTNGKTTTTNLIADFFEDNGLSVATNRLGANIDTGVATTLSSSVNIFNKTKKEVVVLELDERFSRYLLKAVRPDYVIVTNLFRDSLKRNAHPEYIFNILKENIPSSTKCILNANDLCSSRLGDTFSSVYFGMAKLKEDKEKKESLVMDYSTCTKCDTPLTFDSLKYHHIGICHCENCGFESKKADCVLKEIQENQIVVDIKGKEYTFPKISSVLFHLYNELAAITLFHELQFPYEKICEILKKHEVTDTRLKEEEKKGVKIVQMMAKGQSAISCTRTLDYVANNEEEKTIILLLDDYYDRQNSSEFIGWIYDVDFEYLKSPSVKQVFVGGPRCLDYKVRLLMAGIEREKTSFSKDELEIVKKIDFQKVKNIYILYDTSTYDLSCQVKKELLLKIEKNFEISSNIL